MVLVDDILRTGKKISELKTLLESRGAQVVGLAVIIYQPSPDLRDFARRQNASRRRKGIAIRDDYMCLIDCVQACQPFAQLVHVLG